MVARQERTFKPDLYKRLILLHEVCKPPCTMAANMLSIASQAGLVTPLK